MIIFVEGPEVSGIGKLFQRFKSEFSKDKDFVRNSVFYDLYAGTYAHNFMESSTSKVEFGRLSMLFELNDSNPHVNYFVLNGLMYVATKAAACDDSCVGRSVERLIRSDLYHHVAVINVCMNDVENRIDQELIDAYRAELDISNDFLQKNIIQIADRVKQNAYLHLIDEASMDTYDMLVSMILSALCGRKERAYKDK